jgi:PII-like signaling protein
MKLLLIFIDENDLWEQTPLYEAIVRRLRQLDVAGATVHVGRMGFGRHSRIHRPGLFGIPDDRPVTISVLDEEEKLRQVLPEIRSMAPEGVLVLLEAEVIP